MTARQKPPSLREVARRSRDGRSGTAELGKTGTDEKGTDAGIFWVTPSVTFGDSSLWEGAFRRCGSEKSPSLVVEQRISDD